MQLKNIANIKLGYSLREKILPDINGNAFLLMPKDISATGEIIFDNINKVNINHAEKYLIQDSEVLLTSRGRFISSVFNSPNTNNNFIASSGFHRIEIKDKNFLPEYVALFLNSVEGQKELWGIQESMTIPAITIRQLMEISIPHINLEKQKKLINITKTFSQIKLLRQRQDILQSKFINQLISKTIGETND